MRGQATSQLQSADGTRQNLYGFDPIQYYVNMYVPTLFQGTEFRVGRLWTPFGYESLEGWSTPFVSRSYNFNWCPPFTHMGIGMYPKFSKNWSGVFMLANGNDVWFVPEQEPRFVGNLSWTSSSGNDSLTFGTSVGRGAFNAGSPFNPATIGLQTEPAGRPNINVFDFLWNHRVTDRFVYAAELIYGYQTGVPANVLGGIIDERLAYADGLNGSGTAHWGSFAQYFTYTLSSKLTSITRFELFQDFEGSRTGFEGLYTAITTGFQYRPMPDLLIRPEVRYDVNNQSRAFEGEYGLFTAALDVVIRW